MLLLLTSSYFSFVLTYVVSWLNVTKLAEEVTTSSSPLDIIITESVSAGPAHFISSP